MANGGIVWFCTWLYGSLGCQLLHKVIQLVLSESSSKLFSTLALLPLCFAAGFIDRDDRLMRGIVSLAGVFYTIRASQTFLEERFHNEPIVYRFLHTGGTFHDIQLCNRNLKHGTKKPIIMSCLSDFVRNLIGVGISIGVLNYLNSMTYNSWRFTLACMSGGFYVLFSLELFGLALEILYVPFGIKVPKLMLSPLSALSLKEFWRSRWDTVVQEILASYVYYGARRRVGLRGDAAVLLTFCSSGLLHIVPLIYGGLNFQCVLLMFVYFVSQALLLFLERYLQVDRWNYLKMRRTWAIFCIAAPSPLIMMPLFSLLGFDNLVSL